MEAILLIAVIVALAVVAMIVWYGRRRRRTAELRGLYGPEYEHTLQRVGSRRRAEEDLRRRQERVALLDIRPLSAAERDEYAQDWRAIQTRFVDDPEGAVRAGDELVEEVMKARGYPVSDFEQRAADISVHHPRVANNYRAVREIGIRHRRGEASTEDLRQAMIYYRELFEDLLEDRQLDAEQPLERTIERPVAREGRGVDPLPGRGGRVGRADREVLP